MIDTVRVIVRYLIMLFTWLFEGSDKFRDNLNGMMAKENITFTW